MPKKGAKLARGINFVPEILIFIIELKRSELMLFLFCEGNYRCPKT